MRILYFTSSVILCQGAKLRKYRVMFEVQSPVKYNFWKSIGLKPNKL